MEQVSFLKMVSPVGELTIFATQTTVVGIAFALEESQRRIRRYIDRYYGGLYGQAHSSVAMQAKREICEYFDNKRRGFDFLFDYKGTAFQHCVWEALCKVPYGTAVTYGQLAKLAGVPQAPRAVGAACGANPLAIIIPCHRAVGTTGSLTKFGGGLDAKCLLLQLEGHSIDGGKHRINSVFINNTKMDD